MKLSTVPRRNAARRRNESGAALIEFALCSILFFLVTFGIMDFGRAIWEYNVVSFGAREGARWASVRGAASGHTATATDIQNYVLSRSTGVGVTVTTAWYPDNQAGSAVEVQVQHTFTPVLPVIPQTALTLRSRSRMIIAR